MGVDAVVVGWRAFCGDTGWFAFTNLELVPGCAEACCPSSFLASPPYPNIDDARLDNNEEGLEVGTGVDKVDMGFGPIVLTVEVEIVDAVCPSAPDPSCDPQGDVMPE
jgi:hypothetical protein